MKEILELWLSPDGCRFVVLGGLLVGVAIVYQIVRHMIIAVLESARNKKRLAEEQKALEDKKNRLIQQYVNWHRGVSEAETIDKVETDLLLRDGEECLWEERLVSMYETRSVKGEQEWSRISWGVFYITSKKIFFDGASHDRKIDLDKIVTLKACWSAIEVSVENRQKSVVFEGLNGKICQQIVKCCLGQELGKVSLGTDYVPVGDV